MTGELILGGYLLTMLAVALVWVRGPVTVYFDNVTVRISMDAGKTWRDYEYATGSYSTGGLR
ncbi:hypothetical protein LCGC14_2990010 [marine sediment metagenome]|uniref:Uncharacterized protein n=1 Tax=marine sediment metagenome TaxID=412755 RepID=A0A0F8XRQ9_9ZZZZ